MIKKKGDLSAIAGRNHYEPSFKAKIVPEVLKEENDVDKYMTISLGLNIFGTF